MFTQYADLLHTFDVQVDESGLPILRRTDPEAVGGYWHVTDVQFSTMALLDNNAKVYERVWYTPYGEARRHRGQDITGDRAFDTADVNALLTKVGGGVFGGGVT